MNSLKLFDSDEFGLVRIVEIDGEPWFVGKDVARALGYSNASKAVMVHVSDDDKIKEMLTADTQNGNVVTETTLINESGMYSLIFGSKLESARRFKHWVTSEVLPSIRKSGSYTSETASRYPAKSTSVGEVVNLIKVVSKTSRAQGMKPSDIAVMVKGICEQFGISLPDNFVRPDTSGGFNKDYGEVFENLTDRLRDMVIRPYKGGFAVPAADFSELCDVMGIDSGSFRNGYIERFEGRGGIKYSQMVRVGGKVTRCVIFSDVLSKRGDADDDACE